jgi:hypothetical protein
MQFSHQHHFAASVEAVAQMLVNEGFATRRGRSGGASECDVLVDGTAVDGFQVSIRRVVPSTTIPAEFRSFVGSSLTVKYAEVWEPATATGRIGTFAAEIVGTPGHVSGALDLSPEGGGTEFRAVGNVVVQLPLVGPMIERAIVSAVTQVFDAELQLADAWLAGER